MSQISSSLSAHALKSRINILDVVRADLGSSLKQKGHEYHACCPFHEEKSPSFTVVPARGFYHCFGCGAHGDIIEYYCRRMNVDFKTAVEALSAQYGLDELSKNAQPKAQAAPAKTFDKSHAIKRAAALYKDALPALDSPVIDYLRARKIKTDILSEDILKQLRFKVCDYFAQVEGRYKSIGSYPAMLAPLQNNAGKVTGIHMTYLNEDASAKLKITHPETGESLPAKKMRGVSFGSMIRLGAFNRVMAVSEGIENGLSFNSVYPDIPVWVAGSLNNMAGTGKGYGKPHPRLEGRKLPSTIPDLSKPGLMLPYGLRKLYLIVDNDMKDPESGGALVERAVKKFRKRGANVVLIMPPLGCDLNDVLIKSGGIK